MKRFPIVRVICCVVAAGLVVAGILFLVRAQRISSKIRGQWDTQPFDLVVDMSEPGEFAAEFEQTWGESHQQTIYLHVRSGVPAEGTEDELVAGLELEWEIRDADGEMVTEGEYREPRRWGGSGRQGAIPLDSFEPLAVGTYTLAVTVVKGAPGLAGVEQRLVCEYVSCVMALMPGMIAGMAGLLSLAVGGILFVVVGVVTWWKKDKRREEARGNRQ